MHGKTFYNFINKNVKVAKSSRYVANLSLLRYHVQNRNVSTQPQRESYVDGVKLNKNMFYAVQSLVVTVYPVSLPEWDCLATLNQPNVNFRHYIVRIFVLCIRLDHCVWIVWVIASFSYSKRTKCRYIAIWFYDLENFIAFNIIFIIS